MTYRLLLATLGSIKVQLNLLARGIAVKDLGASLEDDALLLQDLLDRLGNLGIHARATNLVQELDNGNLGSQPGPNGSHLESDNTTADNNQALGHLLERNSASARDNTLLVDLESGEGGDLATGGDEYVLAGHGGLATVVQLDLDGVLVLECAGALDVLNAVLLEEVLDTFCQAGDRCVLGLHQLGEVELDVTDLDTAVFGVVEDLVVEMGVVEEGL